MVNKRVNSELDPEKEEWDGPWIKNNAEKEESELWSKTKNYRLQDVKKHHQRFMDLSPDPTAIIKNRRCLFINKAFRRVFCDYLEDKKNKFDFFSLVQEKDRRWLLEQYKKGLKERKTNITSHIELIAGNGRLIPSELSTTPIYFNDLSAALVIIHDKTEQKKADAEIKELLEFEHLIAELSAVFVKTPAAEIDKEIICALRRIAKFLQADRSSLVKFDEETNELKITHTWPVGDSPPMSSFMVSDAFPYAASKVLSKDIFSFSSINDLPEEAVLEREYIKKNKAKSAVVVPLIVGGKVAGALSIGSHKKERHWPPQLVGRMVLIGEVIANALTRKRFEKELHTAALYLDSMADSFISIDRQKKIVLVNKAFEKLWCYSAEEITAKSFSQLFTEREYMRCQKKMALGVETDDSEPFDTVALTKHGKTILVSAFFRVLKDKTGQVEEYIGVFRDITERVNNLKNIEKYASDLKKFQLAVDNASDLIVITDMNGKILHANRATEQITGFSVSELIGKKAGSKDNWGGKMSPDFYSGLWRRVKREKKSFTGEINNCRKNGEKYDSEIRISPILDRQGKVIFLIGTERDITKQKEVERAKSEFVSLASHQLRTPLTSISLSLEMLLKDVAGKIQGEQKEYLRHIYEDVFKMSELIETLLIVSKMETGTFAASNNKFNLRVELDKILEEVLPLVKEKKLKFKKYFDTCLPKFIEHDRGIIRIVVQNILLNAIKYTQSGGTIEFSSKYKNPEIIFSIKDNGYGIPQNEQEQIFKKYFRGNNIIKREASGIGIGLYIAKSLITGIGGRIWFDSRENQGTTFYVFLPVRS